MEPKKNPKLDIYNHSSLFFQMGLLITMTLIVGSFEWKTAKMEDAVIQPHLLRHDVLDYIPSTDIKEKQPPKPKKITLPKKQIVFIPSTDAPDTQSQEPVQTIETELDDPVYMPDPEVEIAPTITDYAEYMPEPVKGYEHFYAFLAKNIKYPARARSLEIEGKVYVRFIVDQEGQLSNLEVVRGIGAGCDQEVLRVLKLDSLPAWKPGRSGGRNVWVRMLIPVAFKLQ